jgi:hypothetical protein
MTTRESNIRLIKDIAVALGELNDKAVFVGGAAVPLYVNNPAAEDVRPTRDIDLFLEIISYGQLGKLQQKLTDKGFFPAKDEEIMCRFEYKGILVDIMSTDEVGWAPADKWFKPGLANLVTIKTEEVEFKILHISYFLAAKFNAFNDRKMDPRLSKHFEDIIYLLDNCTDLFDQLKECSGRLRDYLVSELSKLLNPDFEEAILAHLGYHYQVDRMTIIKEKIKTFINII